MVKPQTPLNPTQVAKLLGIDYERLPKHIAVIPDGNGRWAKMKGMPRVEGHRHGIETVRKVVRECRRLGVKFLTLYAFSTENWNRPKDEVSALWLLLKLFVEQDLPELKENGVRLKVIGQTERIPEDTMEKIRIAVDQTSQNDSLVLTIALSYSGRDELVRAAKMFATAVKSGKANIEDLNEENFPNYLYTGQMPDPDLLIRTSGEFRISNYLLWQLAYSEIYIVNKLWPDFDVDTLHRAIKSFCNRERRFGRTGDQLIESD